MSKKTQHTQLDGKSKSIAETRSQGEAITGRNALSPGLYLVATPIGNLDDITLRALHVLKGAHVIACEDTRTSATLLKHYGIHTPTIAYHEHNADKARPDLLRRLAAGEVVALISDAGTPLISDPGYKLVRETTAAGHAIIPIPGASSVLTALIASGQPTDQFTFLGFIPAKAQARREWVEAHRHSPHTLIAFESPHRLLDTLAAMRDGWGDSRELSVARELTKRFEEHRRGTLAELTAHYAAHGEPKGEIVLIIGRGETPITTDADIDTLLQQALAAHSVKDAAALVAAATGQPKRQLYQRALALHHPPS